MSGPRDQSKRQDLNGGAPMKPGLFRAKYVVVIQGGREMPALLPGAAELVALPAGTIVAGGEAELHTLGAGALGFTVQAWSESGLRCRELKDCQLLAQHYLPEEGVQP